jgi:hypothetical protein
MKALEELPTDAKKQVPTQDLGGYLATIRIGTEL